MQLFAFLLLLVFELSKIKKLTFIILIFKGVILKSFMLLLDPMRTFIENKS